MDGGETLGSWVGAAPSFSQIRAALQGQIGRQKRAGGVEVRGGSPAERVTGKRKQKHDANELLATGSLNQMLSDEFSISPIVACTSLPFGSPHLLQMWFNLLRLG